MKICFSGTHGSGKSSGAAYLASLLKQKHPEKSVIVLEENVRKIKRALNGELNTDTFQKLAIVDQIQREIIEANLHDIIICDRSTLDPLVYAAELSELPRHEYVELALANMDTFNKVFFVRPDSQQQDIANDGFRFTDKEIRNRIDEAFEGWIQSQMIQNVIEVKTSEIFSFDYLGNL